jgi:uncharacterized membrane protein YbhN (UPF0104 family)
VRIAFGLTIGALCIAEILRSQGSLAEVFQHLLAVKPLWLAVALAMLAVDYALRVLRWWVLVAALAPGLAPGRCAGPLFAGLALNNVLPMRLGDVARGALFTRELGLGASAIFATLMLERLIDLLVLLVVFALGTQMVPAAQIDQAVVHAAGKGAAAGAVTVVMVIALPGTLAALVSALARRLPGPLARVFAWIANLFAAVARLRAPRVLGPALVLSLAAWGFELAVFVAVARAVTLDCGALVPPFAVAAGSLATLVPSTPGHIGPFDLACMKALETCGVPAPAAFAFDVVVHALMLGPLTLAGLSWLLLRRRA